MQRLDPGRGPGARPAGTRIQRRPRGGPQARGARRDGPAAKAVTEQNCMRPVGCVQFCGSVPSPYPFPLASTVPRTSSPRRPPPTPPPAHPPYDGPPPRREGFPSASRPPPTPTPGVTPLRPSACPWCLRGPSLRLRLPGAVRRPTGLPWRPCARRCCVPRPSAPRCAPQRPSAPLCAPMPPPRPPMPPHALLRPPARPPSALRPPARPPPSGPSAPSRGPPRGFVTQWSRHPSGHLRKSDTSTT